VPAWAFDHPLRAFLVFLLLEAFLPVRFQPTAWALRGAIRAYQFALSPLMPTRCKFTPTCSAYGLGCVRKYGTLRGGTLTAWRILRCNPFSSGGLDPVP
jgi:hypothetical protein